MWLIEPEKSPIIYTYSNLIKLVETQRLPFKRSNGLCSDARADLEFWI